MGILCSTSYDSTAVHHGDIVIYPIKNSVEQYPSGILNVTNTTAVTMAIRDVKTQAARSASIDKLLLNDKIDSESRVKILLLGGADAGKSTILKQMRILHMSGFSEDEMRSFHKYLRYNIFQDEIDRFAEDISFISGMDEEHQIKYLLNFFTMECVRSFLQLYPSYSSLPDNAQYFLPILSKLLSPGYSPTADDILHLRIPTISVNEINFTFTARSIRLIDVGGQRTYRKKWIHCFEGVAAVLFVASMAAYDQALDDVDKTIEPVLYNEGLPVETVKSKRENRLRDSALLFGEMLRSRFLFTAAFIIFLNKKDLFTKKLASAPLENFISGYKGETDYDATECIKEYFLKRKSRKDKDRTIYCHFTCATDTQNVEFVFEAACHIILQKNLDKSGLHGMGITISKGHQPNGGQNVKYEVKDKSRSSLDSIHSPTAPSVSAGKPNLKVQAVISSSIDEVLLNEKRESTKRVKILLLGGADAGKSTILKQMRILHMNGFSAEEMRSFNKYLRYNLFQNEIYRFADDISWIVGINEQQEIECLLNFMSLNCVRSFLELYPAYSSLPDNAQYYIPKLTSLLARDYSPSAEDILHLRIPTTSINEINFSFSKRTIRLIDVGGQRSYRKKWIHCFEGVDAVLFVASMAAYDQDLEEVDKMIKPVHHKDIFPAETAKPKRQNRLRDSAQLFGDMLRNRFLITASFILFLNKKDIFYKKIARDSLENYINGYKGTTNDDAAECIKEYFLKRKSRKDQNRTIYSHFTCATDTKNVEFVFAAACDIVLQKNLENGGIQ